MNTYDKDWLPAMLMEQVVLGVVLTILSFLIFGPLFQYISIVEFHGISYRWASYPILLIPYAYCVGIAIQRIKFRLESIATSKEENK